MARTLGAEPGRRLGKFDVASSALDLASYDVGNDEDLGVWIDLVRRYIDLKDSAPRYLVIGEHSRRAE